MKSCNPFMILSHAKKNTLRIVDRYSVVVVVVEASGKSRFPRVYESRHLHVFIKEFLLKSKFWNVFETMCIRIFTIN